MRGYPLVAPGLGTNAEIVNADWRTYVPKIIIVGAGTAPTYVTNSGRFMVANNVVRVDIFLNGNGGTAGSGAGQLSVSLPGLPSPLRQGGFLTPIGYSLNGVNYNVIAGTLSPTSPFMLLSEWATASSIAALTAGDQNNATRTISLIASKE